MPLDVATFLKALTSRPGVYQMLGADDAVLYVGKAKNLRKRVGSYFRNSGLAPKTRALVEKIDDIQVTVTQSEVEALILEQNLIKQYRPPYNVLLRDDKSYPYILLTEKEEFPRLAFHRGSKRIKGSYFGPYPSVGAVRESMTFLQKTFKVRQCEDSFFRNRSRPCLQYQIKRCTGPCVGLVTPADYARDVNYTRLFLEGKSDRLMRELEADMDRSSAQLAFEQAAEYRDRIAALRQIQTEQVVETGRGQGSVDVIAAELIGDSACVHMLFIRQGRMLGSRSFYPRVPLAADAAEVLAEFIPQYYLKGDIIADLPREIIAPVKSTEARELTEALGGALQRRLELRASVRGNRARWLDLAHRTASQNLAGRVASRQNVLRRLESLRDSLNLADTPERLECFDISHSSGEATVASCVVFGPEGAIKSDYRRFNIDDITAGDDYAAMEQALRRRFTRLKKGEGKLPDILLIDGGKGQLRRAVDVLNDLGVVGVTTVGVAKGSTRKPGMETLLLAALHGDSDPVDRETVLTVDSPALHLVQQIRDEAHRFAITGHRQRRDVKRRSSPLEGIDGVGPKRRRELLRFFGGIVEVEKASVADLMRVPTINRKVAESIYSALHSG